MIDIWMLLTMTMTLSFLEVVLHTTNEVCARPYLGPERQIGVVVPVNKFEKEGADDTDKGASYNLKRLTRRLNLTIGALTFTIAFWVVGVIKSYSARSSHRNNKFDCLEFDLS